MKLRFSGIDWETAALDRRGIFGLSAEQVEVISSGIRGMPGVCGCVILSTCNRTEVYLTEEAVCAASPAALLCNEMGLPYGENSRYFRHLEGEAAARHLLEVACGLRSQIVGEDQIISQVKAALSGAQAAKNADSVLQTLFRLAVTAGKEVRSKVRLGRTSLSVAERAVEQIEAAAGGIAGRQAVVIGNGEMGRLAAALLVERGGRVIITLRSYRHGETVVPRGCGAIPYDRRMEATDGSDFLISATKSPHYTVTAAQIKELARPPAFIADLAVPRDIEKTVGLLPGICFFDMDTVKDEQAEADGAAARGEARAIIENHITAFYKWWNYKSMLVSGGRS